VKTAAEAAPVPMSLHLDHSEDFDTAQKCIGAGFTSVMIDGSHLKFEDNIALTKRVVDIAHPKGVSVEAELGRLAGVEESTIEEKDAILTDPNVAAEFVEKTEVDALAVAIGTSHGAYKFKIEPKLDFGRLELIKEKWISRLCCTEPQVSHHGLLKRQPSTGPNLKEQKESPKTTSKKPSPWA
jgi:fructose-bisphosphate aldolase class II